MKENRPPRKTENEKRAKKKELKTKQIPNMDPERSKICSIWINITKNFEAPGASPRTPIYFPSFCNQVLKIARKSSALMKFQDTPLRSNHPRTPHYFESPSCYWPKKLKICLIWINFF